MSEYQHPHEGSPLPPTANPWKWVTIGVVGSIAAIAIVGLVVASLDTGGNVAQTQGSSESGASSAPEHAVHQPSGNDIAACNQYAASVRSQPNEAFKDGVIGGALGAGIGAATGAIADGGKGAGKGAGIGAIVGATAGTLYGLDKANRSDERAAAAYRACMAERGY